MLNFDSESDQEQEGSGIRMEPMIDCVFLLLLFFIVVIAAFVQIVEMFIERVSERLYAALGMML